jgi:transposase
MSAGKQYRRHLSIVYPLCAGIDVGSRQMWVAIPASSADQSVRCFGVYTEDLYSIRDWLLEYKITTVAMESTSVYWIPLYDVLSAAGLDVCLVNPREFKGAPGRKTDIMDCQWLQELHTFGLLRPSFRPDDHACAVRSLVRQRQSLIESAGHQVQLMQKALIQMNVRLTEVVADISGLTGMNIIRDILSGKHDAQSLAAHRDKRCKRSKEEFAKALLGTWRAEHLLSLRQAVELYDLYQKHIIEAEKAIESTLKERPQPEVPHHDDDNPTSIEIEPRRKSKSDYHVAIGESWKSLTGVDLTQIDGISDTAASIIMSEAGLNIESFNSSGKFTAWLGLCPAHKISGGKILQRSTKPCANRIAKVLRMCAVVVGRTDSTLGAFYRRLGARAGKSIAVTATARKLAVLVWSMLTYGSAYIRESAENAQRKHEELQLKQLQKRAEKFGLSLVASS